MVQKERPEDAGFAQCTASQPASYELNTASHDTTLVFTVIGFVALIILIALQILRRIKMKRRLDQIRAFKMHKINVSQDFVKINDWDKSTSREET